MPSSSPYLTISTRTFLPVAVNCFAAFALFFWVFSLRAESPLAESLAADHPVIGMMGPFAAIALLSGLFVGALATTLTRAHALRLAAWSGLVACLLTFGAAVVAGGVKWTISEGTVLLGPFVAGGLALGALLVRKVRRA